MSKKCTSSSNRILLTVENDSYDQERTVRAINGEIVTESESDDPEVYVTLKNPLSTVGRQLLVQKRTSIRRRARRKTAKAIAEQHFLSHKVPRRVSRILQECPDIGKTIENFVEEHSVGADAWRRTGILTFDANTRIKQKLFTKKSDGTLKKNTNTNFLTVL